MSPAVNNHTFSRPKGPNVDDYLIKEVSSSGNCSGSLLRRHFSSRAASPEQTSASTSGKTDSDKNGGDSDGDSDSDSDSDSDGSATVDTLQILGILSHLENLGLLAFLDERMWRAMLLACGKTGGTSCAGSPLYCITVS